MVEKTLTESQIIGQDAVWNRLVAIKESDRVGSGYLFHGPAGAGKEAVAIQFASLLNCLNASDLPCLACPSCSKFTSLQHPNLHIVVPLPRDRDIRKDDPPLKALSAKSVETLTDLMGRKGRDPYLRLELPRAKTILLNSIREIREKVYLKAVEAGQKVVLIFEAEKLMSQQGESANALLKILEEPPENTTIILCTEYPDRLFETVWSRCQSIAFPAVAETAIASYLEERFDVAPDEAMLVAHLSQGNVKMAKSVAETDLGDVTSLLRSLLSWASSGIESDWRRFLAHGAATYRSSPSEFVFHLQLLSYWFRDALHVQKLNGESQFILSMMEEEIHKFSDSYPAADYPRIIAAVEKCADSLARNLHLNLVLMNLLMEVRDGLKGVSR